MLLFTMLFVALPAFAQEALPLTQHYTSSDEMVVFSYPADWKIYVAGGNALSLSVDVGTSDEVLHQDLINNEVDIIASGEARVTVAMSTKADIAQFAGMAADASVLEILPKLLKQANSKN